MNSDEFHDPKDLVCRRADHLSVFCCALLTQRLGVCLKESSCG
jgi:hypothetical protein